MKLTKIDKNGHWWVREKTDWAAEDKDGQWWILRNKKPTMKTNDKRRKGQTSNMFTMEHYIIVALASALGISLALNAIALMS